MTTKIEKIKIDYKGNQVSACKLTVASEIPIDMDTAWTMVQTSALLNFVADGKVKFKPTGGQFPEIWKEGDTVSTKMLVYGFVLLSQKIEVLVYDVPKKIPKHNTSGFI